MRDLALTTPLDELRAAWHATAHLAKWATGLYDAVVAELASAPGPACEEWLWTSLGAARVHLLTGLQDGNRPTAQASTALTILLLRDMLNRLRHVMPAGAFDLLDHPIGLPGPLKDFVLGHRSRRSPPS